MLVAILGWQNITKKMSFLPIFLFNYCKPKRRFVAFNLLVAFFRTFLCKPFGILHYKLNTWNAKKFVFFLLLFKNKFKTADFWYSTCL